MLSRSYDEQFESVEPKERRLVSRAWGCLMFSGFGEGIY
jgi:hypothetical protein